MTWVAYVDESIRTSEGVYVLAAAVLDGPEHEKVRDRVAQLSQRGMPFYWRLEVPQRRAAAVELLTELSSLHVAVVGAPVNPRRQERARRQCVEAMLTTWSPRERHKSGWRHETLPRTGATSSPSTSSVPAVSSAARFE